MSDDSGSLLEELYFRFLKMLFWPLKHSGLDLGRRLYNVLRGLPSVKKCIEESMPVTV